MRMNELAASRCLPGAVRAQQVEDLPGHRSPWRRLATSRSFQTPRNWKIPHAAIAGTDSGSTTFRNTPNADAPSILAA